MALVRPKSSLHTRPAVLKLGLSWLRRMLRPTGSTLYLLTVFRSDPIDLVKPLVSQPAGQHRLFGRGRLQPCQRVL